MSVKCLKGMQKFSMNMKYKIVVVADVSLYAEHLYLFFDTLRYIFVFFYVCLENQLDGGK